MHSLPKQKGRRKEEEFVFLKRPSPRGCMLLLLLLIERAVVVTVRLLRRLGSTVQRLVQQIGNRDTEFANSDWSFSVTQANRYPCFRPLFSGFFLRSAVQYVWWQLRTAVRTGSLAWDFLKQTRVSFSVGVTGVGEGRLFATPLHCA
ncbi:hypothetical protein L873DRAFT_25557 [Choiromyces venosus 120613-1]|uniref:Uncharacterized protein n=1 Tax=Choiromyces venosus 120613-1 TaxID=1336337 RepID=A0A3N4K6G7_9PEZI|nr:hypothetical protein L873DRAFT_25557 [Choiromyces venosus 120613-1]